MKPKKVENWQDLGSEWIAEVKIDGHGGCIEFDQNGYAVMHNMGANDVTAFLPTLHAPVLAGTWLQVEFAATRDGRDKSLSADVTSLLSDGGIDRVETAKVYVLDVALYRSKNLTGVPYTDRILFRENVVSHMRKHWPSIEVLEPEIAIGRHRNKQVAQWFADGEEGAVFKRRDSGFMPGLTVKSGDWLKFKPVYTVDAIARTYTEGKGRNTGRVGSLNLTLLLPSGLEQYIGSCSGMSDEQRDEFTARLDAGEVLVVEVEYERWTINGHLRFARFLQERPDKRPEDCTWADQGPCSTARAKAAPVVDKKQKSSGGWKPLVRASSRMWQMYQLANEADLTLFEEGRVWQAVHGHGTEKRVLALFYKGKYLGAGLDADNIEFQIGQVNEPA